MGWPLMPGPLEPMTGGELSLAFLMSPGPVVCSGEVAGSVYPPGSLWEQPHHHEWQCHPLLPDPLPGL